MKKVIGMPKISNNIMKEVCQLSFQNELETITKLNMNSIKYQTLSEEQVDQLAIKIGLLPLEYRNILFFRYCFNNPPSKTEKILEIENVIGKLRYIQKMLSAFMGLKNSWIDDNSMKKACEIALIEDAKDYDNTLALHKPNYSKNFRRKLKDIKISQKTNSIFMKMVKRVAVFILVCFLSFSTVLVVNAEVRERFFDWVVVTFPKFSIFIPQNINKDTIDLKSLKINYVPMDFKLVNINEGHNMLIYNYATENNKKLDISFLASSRKGKSYYDAENIEIEEFIFKESNAYMWQTDEMTYLIWSQDDIECHISGNLDKNEVIKIAENILK